MSQTQLLAEDADDVVARAIAEHRPITKVCLFSGGHDSTALAHRCRAHYDHLAFIDTGTAVPGVRAFVESFAGWIDKPLVVYDSADAYRHMVVGTPAFWERYPGGTAPGEVEAWVEAEQLAGREVPGAPSGFPGPGNHPRAYSRLKERQIEAMLRDMKVGQPRDARVLFLSGVRRAESARRSKRLPITRRGSGAFCNPLIDWSNYDVRAYRALHRIPESDVAALMHRSGECNCGAYAAAGERELLMSLFPEWWASTIAPLEREAERLGLRWCRWNGYDLAGTQAGNEDAPRAAEMCSSCESRQIAMTL